MFFIQYCEICKKNKIKGGSNINENIFTQFRAFKKKIERKGWRVLNVDDKETIFICPFCDKRIFRELKKRKEEIYNEL